VTHPHYGHSPTYIRPSPAVGVKIATQKVPISTLTTGYLKNTPTIISIPFFIFLKYYFLIFFFIFYFFSLLPLTLQSPPTPKRSCQRATLPKSENQTLPNKKATEIKELNTTHWYDERSFPQFHQNPLLITPHKKPATSPSSLSNFLYQSWPKVCKTIAARVQLLGCSILYEVSGFTQISGMELLYKTCGATTVAGSEFEERRDTALSVLEKWESENLGVVVLGRTGRVGEWENINKKCL